MNGEKIKVWRKKKGLTRYQLADLLSTTYDCVTNWELGRNSPRGTAKQRLDDIMFGRVALIPLSAQEEKLLDEAMRRAGYTSREKFLTAILTDIIKAGGLTADQFSDMSIAAETPAKYMPSRKHA